MPYRNAKRNARKRPYKRNYRRGNRRYKKTNNSSNFGNGRSVVVYKPGIIRSPLPMQYITKFVASAFMYSTSGAATGDYTFNFKLNSMYHPFANAAPAGVTYNTINIATYNPAGYGTLLDADVYTTYTVIATLFEFDVIPQSVSDPVSVAVTASRTGSVPASVAASLSKPWTKSMAFVSGRNYREGDYPLKMYIPIHKFLGIPKSFYMYDTSGQWDGSYNTDATNTLELVANVETGDNAVLSSPLEFRVRITYYARLRDLVTENLVN